MNIFSMSFRRLKYRILRSYKNVNEENLTSEQKNGLKVIRALASKVDTDITVAPISNRYYLKRDNIFVILEQDKVTIANSVYHYEIHYPIAVYSRVIFFIKKILERRQLKMEMSILNKINTNLSKVYEDLMNFNKNDD